MTSRLSRQPVLDRFACDPDAWFASARFTYAASQTLFNDGNIVVVFAAATLGHHAVEMFLKTALICEGMTICHPRDARSFRLTEKDFAWGHDLKQLAGLLCNLRQDFDLRAEMDVRGYWPHKMPMTVADGLELFQPFFEELRYPREKKQMEGIGREEVIVLNALVRSIQPFISIWNNPYTTAP